VPALQLAGQCDGCMGADVRRRAHNMLHFGCEHGWLPRIGVSRSSNKFDQVFANANLGFSNSYELVIIEGGHFPHIERGEQLSRVLSLWLTSA
jgi:hypothetical protein